MRKGALTLLTALRPTTLGKAFKLGASGLEKVTAGDLCEGTFVVKEFATATELASILLAVGTHQAISASLPKCGMTSGTIVTKAAVHNFPNALTRTKEDFSFTYSQPGIVVLDYDPPSNAKALSRDELWALLISVMPKLEHAGAVWWCSGSSYIYSGDSEIQGLRGQRIYLLVSDLGDTWRFGEVLGKRLWLAGLGHIVVSASGQRLSRCVFDAAMFQAARLDFVGGAVCHPPLEQRRGSPIVLSEGDWLDTRSSLPDLIAEEEAEYEALIESAKVKAEPEVCAAREKWKSARIQEAISRLSYSGVPLEQAEERVERTLSCALSGVLLGDFKLTLADGKDVSVGEVLENRGRYHGELTLDPLEPEYQNNKVTGKLYLLGASPTLHSFAHGGTTYRLRRQPSRLYVQRGRKAELADDIHTFLLNEPDVFLRGGLLVAVAEGRVRTLRKAGLMHLISSRIALYSKTEKGLDVPADVPSDVVDMVFSLVER